MIEAAVLLVPLMFVLVGMGVAERHPATGGLIAWTGVGLWVLAAVLVLVGMLQ